MLYNDGKFLLVDHKKLRLWLPVGGELENGETPQQAGRREVMEETGLECEFVKIAFEPRGTPDGFLGYEEHETGIKGVHMNFCFLATTDSRDVKTDGSFNAHQWVTYAEALKLAQDVHVPRNVIDLFDKIHGLSKQNLVSIQV
jgi:8-oxo-dGTP pyrophosphatase MutT (NUDIX family)